MPLYMDVHKNAGQLTPEEIAAAHLKDLEAQGRYGVKYLRWWFNEQVGSIYCLVEAPSTEAAVRVHREAHGLTADEIIEVQAMGMEDYLAPGDGRPVVREEPPDAPLATDTAFRTIVFTDLTGSTSLTQQLGDEAAFELFRQHDELMSACLERHNGSRVKHTGDGLMASFASVAKAVECMVEMQRALVEHNRTLSTPLFAHMGAAAGEPVAHDNDLFGATVQLAARLRDQAQPAQILVSSVVRDLCLGKLFPFVEHGELQLKGFNEPVRVFEVRWQD